MLRRLCINSFTVCVFGVPRSTTDAVWHWAAVAASVSSISPHLVSRDEDSSLSSILHSSFSTVLIHEVHSGTALVRTAAIMFYRSFRSDGLMRQSGHNPDFGVDENQKAMEGFKGVVFQADFESANDN